MNALQVLVCGTNYGRIYLEAIRLGGAGYRLAGIFARIRVVGAMTMRLRSVRPQRLNGVRRGSLTS